MAPDGAASPRAESPRRQRPHKTNRPATGGNSQLQYSKHKIRGCSCNPRFLTFSDMSDARWLQNFINTWARERPGSPRFRGGSARPALRPPRSAASIAGASLGPAARRPAVAEMHHDQKGIRRCAHRPSSGRAAKTVIGLCAGHVLCERPRRPQRTLSPSPMACWPLGVYGRRI
jgi:hypothetical protein